MKDLLKKYLKMTDDEKNEIEELYLLHLLQSQLSEKDDFKLNLSDEEIIFEATKLCEIYSGINSLEIIKRLLNLLENNTITTSDIVGFNVDDLIELINNRETEKQENTDEDKILTSFTLGDFYCVFMRSGGRYILIFEKDNNSRVEIYNTFEEMLSYIIKCKLLEERL